MSIVRETKEVEIQKIDSPGKFGNLTKKEFKEKVKVDNLIQRATQSKTFKGYLIGTIKIAKNDGNLEVQKLLEDLLNKFIEYETRVKVRLQGWKGKSSIQIIKKPDKITIITFQKENQDVEPHEVKTEILRDEINNCILALNKFEKGKRIKSKEIAEWYCRISNIRFDNEDIPLFEKGKFKYKSFFAWRYLHTRFNLLLRFFDLEKVIKYRGQYVEIIDDKIQIGDLL